MIKNIAKKLLISLLTCSIVLMPVTVSAASADDSENEVIETESDKILEKSLLQNVTKEKNNYPIVMVHGLSGWGNNEVLNTYYWGGSTSLREMLNNEGYEVYTPTIGPVASNWDRACELYAYLKGGTVDYGQAHSEKYGHNRYGRTFPGVLKDLGTYDENGKLKKVHLMGHSMGGETIRLLAVLLENGNSEEIAASDDSVSDLFKGGQHFVDSITTICTPHDGSQFDEIKNNTQPFIPQLVAAVAALEGRQDINNLDLQLDQWGLKQEDGESEEDYLNKVSSSNIWDNTKDLSVWDLSLEGAKELNSYTPALDDIYYFSVSCSDTHKSLVTKFQEPNLNMSPILINSGFVMGKYTQNEPGKVVVNNEWWKNDGIVSVRSAIAPHEGSNDKIINYTGTPEKGVWNYLGEIKNVDHLQVVAHQNPIQRKYLQNKYRAWAEMLENLQ